MNKRDARRVCIRCRMQRVSKSAAVGRFANSIAVHGLSSSGFLVNCALPCRNERADGKLDSHFTLISSRAAHVGHRLRELAHFLYRRSQELGAEGLADQLLQMQ